MTKRREANTLIELIKKQNHPCKVIEIGVWKSTNIKRLLRGYGSHISELWGIDTFEVGIPSSSRRENRQNAKFWEERYLHACRLMRYFPQLHIVKTISLKASQLFEEEYFDLVFIDAGHQYQSVKEDIAAWLPLVKGDGLISGHDYGARHYPDVKKIVDEIFGDKATAIDGVWFIEKSEIVEEMYDKLKNLTINRGE